jgi:hypothetical protein
MAKRERTFRHEIPHPPVAEVMHVGPADADPPHVDKHLARLRDGTGQLAAPEVFLTMENECPHGIFAGKGVGGNLRHPVRIAGGFRRSSGMSPDDSDGLGADPRMSGAVGECGSTGDLAFRNGIFLYPFHSLLRGTTSPVSALAYSGNLNTHGRIPF